MRLGVLFSGGKDSVYACWKAQEKNTVACLITLLSQNPDSYMFHTPNIRFASFQAEAMNIPQLSWPTRGIEEKELNDLRAALAEAIDQYGIEGIVTGAIESVYQAARVQRICHALDLWCFNPLWQTEQIEYLRPLRGDGFQVIISGVYAYPFDASWLGAELTEEMIMRLARLRERYQINPSGEGGEIETFVLDGPSPLFQKKIEILRASRSYDQYRGQYIIEKMKLVDR